MYRIAFIGHRQLNNCFKVRDERTHFKSAITKRNRWMIGNADLLICFVERQSGGAYLTLKYAKSNNLHIVNLAKS